MLPVIEREEVGAVLGLIALNIMQFGWYVLLALWLTVPGVLGIFRPIGEERAPRVNLGEYACWGGYYDAPESDPELVRILNVDPGCIALATEADS